MDGYTAFFWSDKGYAWLGLLTVLTFTRLSCQNQHLHGYKSLGSMIAFHLCSLLRDSTINLFEDD